MSPVVQSFESKTPPTYFNCSIAKFKISLGSLVLAPAEIRIRE